MVSTIPVILRVSSWTRSTGASCTGANFSTNICPSTTRVTGLAREPGRAQRPSSVAPRGRVAELSGIVIYHPRVATCRGRPFDVRKGTVVKFSSICLLRDSGVVERMGRRNGHAICRHRIASRWCRPATISTISTSVTYDGNPLVSCARARGMRTGGLELFNRHDLEEVSGRRGGVFK